MEDLFRIELILFPEIEIEEELKLFRRRHGDQGNDVPVPDLFHCQKDLKFG